MPMTIKTTITLSMEHIYMSLCLILITGIHLYLANCPVYQEIYNVKILNQPLYTMALEYANTETR